jgi:hypothetical protein
VCCHEGVALASFVRAKEDVAAKAKKGVIAKAKEAVLV